MTRTFQPNDDGSRSIEILDRLRNFPANTCPSSRHAQMVAEGLIEQGRYGMIDDDPGHVGISIATTVAHLYAARIMLENLGYTWVVQGDVPVWKPIDGPAGAAGSERDETGGKTE